MQPCGFWLILLTVYNHLTRNASGRFSFLFKTLTNHDTTLVVITQYHVARLSSYRIWLPTILHQSYLPLHSEVSSISATILLCNFLTSSWFFLTSSFWLLIRSVRCLSLKETERSFFQLILWKIEPSVNYVRSGECCPENRDIDWRCDNPSGSHHHMTSDDDFRSKSSQRFLLRTTVQPLGRGVQQVAYAPPPPPTGSEGPFLGDWRFKRNHSLRQTQFSKFSGGACPRTPLVSHVSGDRLFAPLELIRTLTQKNLPTGLYTDLDDHNLATYDMTSWGPFLETPDYFRARKLFWVYNILQWLYNSYWFWKVDFKLYNSWSISLGLRQWLLLSDINKWAWKNTYWARKVIGSFEERARGFKPYAALWKTLGRFCIDHHFNQRQTRGIDAINNIYFYFYFLPANLQNTRKKIKNKIFRVIDC